MTFTVSPNVYEAVFEHSLDAVFLARPDGALLAANEAAGQMLGLTEDEIIRRGRDGIIAPESPGLEAVLANRDRDGNSRGELLYVHGDGRRIPVEVSSATFTDDTGEAMTVIIARDIRERTRIVEDLQRSRLLLESVVNSTRDFIWLVDPENFAILWHNRSFATYFAKERGITRLVGMRPAELFDSADWVRLWQDLYTQALDQGSVEAEYHVSTGTHVLALTLKRVQREDKVFGIAAFGRDVTDAVDSRRRLEESETRYRTIVDTISEGVVFQAADGTILSVNPAAERIEERDEDDLLGRNSEDPEWGAIRADGTEFPGEDHPAMYTLRTGEALQGVVMGIRTPKGNRRWITINSAPVFDAGAGRPTAVVTTFHDITDQKRAEDELRIAAIAFDQSQEAMIIAAPDTTILRTNEAFTRMTGYTSREVVGQKTTLLSSGLQGRGFYKELWAALSTDHRWQGEIWNRRRDGETFPCWLSINAVTDQEGRVTHYVGTYTDRSEAKKAQQDIYTLAFYDQLTDLPNRRLLLERLRQGVMGSARDPHRGALLLIDLDDFTILNETQGHAAGDLLLTTVAERLQELVGPEDTVARFGSDEFAVVLYDLDPGLERAALQAERAAQELRSAIHTSIELDGHDYRCRSSVGVALFGGGEPDEKELFKQADLALMQAKRDGRDTVRFHNHAVQATLEEHFALESALRQAVPHDLRLVYQPQVDANGAIYGAEALVRWHDDARGVVSPANFIPVAEANGLIVPIGQWVLETACRQVAQWQADPNTRGLSISVNVSARQLHQPDFADVVLRALADSGADASLLTLELTESLLVAETGAVADKMARLGSKGVKFSLDDFGTGFSSLRTLRNLPLQELKIDQSFVRDVAVNPNDVAIARTIIGLGQTLGLSVIAEGVETEEQRKALCRLGCERFQGYLFARPVPIEEFAAILARRAVATG